MIETYIKGDVGTRNWHNNIEIYYAANGYGQILYDNEYIPINENEFCVTNPNVIHSLKSESGITIVNFGISSEFCQTCGIDIESYIFEKTFTDNPLRRKLSTLANTYFLKESDPLYDAKLSMQLLDFCIRLITYHAKKQEKTSPDDPIQLAIGYIKSHLNEKITLNDISNQAGLSKYYLTKKFKESTGQSTTDYINLLRCKQACIYFETTNLSIKDVYNKLYFCSYDYFLRVFKKTIGCTITEYIRRHIPSRTKLAKQQEQQKRS